jgi:uncharacterized protein YkwD
MTGAQPMSHFHPASARHLRLIQAIGCAISAVFVIGVLLFRSIGPESTAVPIALAAPDRSSTLRSQTAITTYAYLPLIRNSTGALVVNPQSREDSLNFYLDHYVAWESAIIGWTGDHASCNPGSTSLDFRTAVLHRINYFRAMAGLPATVTLRDDYNAKAQAAALMMSVNNQLSHNPPTTWQCYSDAGHQGASNSNLYLGVYGWNAISGYMRDPGSGNYFVGHRRWVLYPQTQEMGTGDIPPAGGHSPANALWVFDSHLWESRPATRDEFVAWPPRGYVPYQVVFARWSFAYPSADFSNAIVTMTSGGSNVSLTQSPVVNGYGENTLVWIPLGLSDSASWPKPASDITYTVSVQNVKIGGQSRTFSYDVIVFDPTP